MPHVLQDPRINTTEIAARAFPDKQRDTALKALNRELRKPAVSPPHDAAIRHELGQLHHALHAALLLFAGGTRQMAARTLLRDPRLSERHFAESLFPDVARNAAVLRTRAILQAPGTPFETAQMQRLRTSALDLQAKLAEATGLKPAK